MEGLIFVLAFVVGIFLLILTSECDDEPVKRFRYVAGLLFLVSFLDILGLCTATKVENIQCNVYEIKYPEGFKKQFVLNPREQLAQLEGYNDELKVCNYTHYRNSIFQYSFYTQEKH